MAKYLTQTTETYRFDSDTEAAAFIEEAKKASNYTLTKYSCVHKEKKAKGEIIDSWFRVVLTKEFNIESEPELDITIEYEVED